MMTLFIEGLSRLVWADDLLPALLVHGRLGDKLWIRVLQVI